MTANLQRTPKVFNASFRPPRQRLDLSQYKSLWPFVVVLLIIVAIFLASRLPVFTIRSVEVSGTIDQGIIGHLEDLKGQSLFSRQVSQVRLDILKSNSSVADVDCRRGIPDYLRCAVSMRTPALIWRSGGIDYLADSHSLLYAQYLQTSQQLPIVEDRSATKAAVGQTVANSDLVKIFTDTNTKLNQAGFVVSELFINDTVYQVGAVVTGSTSSDLPYPAGKTISLLMTINTPIDAQITAAKQILKDKGGQVNAQIDLRVPGYAYVK
ncbi:MAG TPA: hypothetical protein VMQ44_01180 [Candidatus Saccharimonadales bacterium]|nr:hypothetical protein [Candidatus Saccharimonadales bacterium]